MKQNLNNKIFKMQYLSKKNISKKTQHYLKAEDLNLKILCVFFLGIIKNGGCKFNISKSFRKVYSDSGINDDEWYESRPS